MPGARRSPARLVTIALLAAAGLGCSSLIGIEEATCDPTVSGCPSAAESKVSSALCDQYCSTVMSACTGTNEAYVSRDACLGVCSFLPEGEPGVVANSVHCRLEVAQIAASSPEVESYCPSAGPSGDGPSEESDCTGPASDANDPCASLCSILMAACARFPQYGTVEECESRCRDEVDASPSDEHYTSSTLVDPLPDRGNTVGCRLWHVAVAATGPNDARVAGLHCPHAAGGAPCVTQQP
jgi:hypothetical protein